MYMCMSACVCVHVCLCVCALYHLQYPLLRGEVVDWHALFLHVPNLKWLGDAAALNQHLHTYTHTTQTYIMPTNRQVGRSNTYTPYGHTHEHTHTHTHTHLGIYIYTHFSQPTPNTHRRTHTHAHIHTCLLSKCWKDFLKPNSASRSVMCMVM